MAVPDTLAAKVEITFIARGSELVSSSVVGRFCDFRWLERTEECECVKLSTLSGKGLDVLR